MSWFKSSYSTSNGNCVEVNFKRASRCESSGCVEVGASLVFEDSIWVRDSKNPDGPVLVFTRAEWDAFLIGVHAGEFDLSI